MKETNRYSAVEAAALIAAGKLTAVELAEDCLARVAAREEAVQAWAHIDPQQVLADARARDAEKPRGPLHGIPFAIKDIIDTAGMPTEYGSPIYAGHRPRADAACVTMLKDAGAVIMGTVGVMGRTVADVALAFAAMTRRDAAGFALPEIPKPRIGFYRTLQWPKADAATMAALEGAASALAKAGARVTEITLPEKFNELAAARSRIGDFESSRSLAWERRHFEDKIAVREKLRKADAVTLDEYLAAQQVLDECRRLLAITFGEFDVLMVPSATGEAPKGLATTGDAVFNQAWTALHTPAVTVPLFTGPSGLPLGAQFVGPYGADYRTLACAQWALASAR